MKDTDTACTVTHFIPVVYLNLITIKFGPKLHTMLTKSNHNTLKASWENRNQEPHPETENLQ
jgi:hypothetical protein